MNKVYLNKSLIPNPAWKTFVFGWGDYYLSVASIDSSDVTESQTKYNSWVVQRRMVVEGDKVSKGMLHIYPTCLAERIQRSGTE